MAKIEYSYELTKIFFIPIIDFFPIVSTQKNIESNSNSLYIIVGLLVYNREHAALVYAIRKEFIAEIERDTIIISIVNYLVAFPLL